MPKSTESRPRKKPLSVTTDFPITPVLDRLLAVYKEHPMALVTEQDPYKVLTACILTLRTTDETAIPASARMFQLAETPQQMIRVPVETLQKAIYPVGFYKTKAQTILDISRDLLDRFGGKTPATIDELLTLKGVGRKTANLVVGLGHGLPAICVDVHVHRICNRFGYIVTNTPDETEQVLRDNLPVSHWPIINKVLVLHGQACCRPIGPKCNECPVVAECQKVDVVPRKSKAKA